MNYVINFVSFEGKNFCQASTNLIEQNHALERVFSIVAGVVLSGGNNNRVEVVVTEFTRVVTLPPRVEAKYGAIGVPLTHCRDISHNGLLTVDPELGPKTLRCVTLSIWVHRILIDCLITKDVRGVCFQCDGRDSADDGVGMEELHPFKNLISNFFIVLLHKLDSKLSYSPRLVGVAWERDIG